jgi:hypothetical protein
VTDAVERVVTLTVETTPRDATHWGTRAMARQCGLSQSTVSRIWRAFSLPPHRSETFTLSPDPLFIDKVRDIVGLYLNPPDKALMTSYGSTRASTPRGRSHNVTLTALKPATTYQYQVQATDPAGNTARGKIGN